MTAIAILDYGMGNLRSVEKAVERVGATPRVTSDHADVRSADGIVLPGVGAFPRAMDRVRQLKLGPLIADRRQEGVPILGICLGFQLLFESSSEGDGARGIGLFPGEVDRLTANGLKVPHIGWSPVRWKRDSRLTESLEPDTPFYFVHSFAPQPASGDDVLGTAAYGDRFVCAVDRDRVFGVQFHPEKSSSAGLKLLQNFAGVCAAAAA